MGTSQRALLNNTAIGHHRKLYPLQEQEFLKIVLRDEKIQYFTHSETKI